ncbi:MAG: hypothetical protein ISR65_09415 [Bacteriovoracaceae bacterium]|nr:hypothetical protein [Bacteriovoracaceae bacterium]
MGIIGKSITVTKTIRNVSRLQEIVLVFAKNGFAEFITRGVTSKIPNFVLPSATIKIKNELKEKKESDWYQIIGYRLRKCFEELGPVFIKFGQILSTREDLLDPSIIEEMKLLRDKVKGIPFDEVKSVLEAALGNNLGNIFSSIDEHPIGTASIAVVHKGTLKDGEEVVLKVRRPKIIKTIETDIAIIMLLVQHVEKISQEIKFLGISKIVADFANGLQHEVNFNIEALNLERFKTNLTNHDVDQIFYIPKIYKKLSSEEVLVIEQIKGIPFTDRLEIEAIRPKLEVKIEKGVGLFVKTFLQDGFFHADLHGGNFFWQDNDRIALVDFGLMGYLSKRTRSNFIAIIYALLSFNYENLVYELLDVAEFEKMPDVEELIADVRSGLSPFIGLTVGQTNFSQVMHTVIRTLNRHQLYLPGEWFIIFRAFIMLDGVAKSIDIDVDLFELLQRDIKELVRQSMTKEDWIEEGVWAGRDVISSLRVIPRHFKWYLKDWAKKNYAIEVVHRGYKKEINRVSNTITFLAFALFAAIFIASGTFWQSTTKITTWKDVPTISWIFWVAGLALFFKGYLYTRKR